MTRRFIPILILLMLLVPVSSRATRIKDIASIDGVRENQLVGYGLVVGLNGSGDSDQARVQTQSLVNALERMGVTIARGDLTVKNVAAVMVTATLPPFSRQGNRIDVLVSSIGDAKSLAGGTLLMTPLKGGDGQTYAVAQGPVVTTSFSYGGQGGSAQKNHPTAGRVPEGGLVEREIPFALTGKETLRLNLHRPDFTTAARIVAAISGRFPTLPVTSSDPGSVEIPVPEGYRDRLVEFVAEIERLDVRPDTTATVVVNERTGTIVMGEEVRISTVAVSHGSLTLLIREAPKVSQPPPLSGGKTATVPRTDVAVKEEQGGLATLKEGASIGDVVRALNALGVSPRDLIGILQAIRAAGALQGELTVI